MASHPRISPNGPPATTTSTLEYLVADGVSCDGTLPFLSEQFVGVIFEECGDVRSLEYTIFKRGSVSRV